MMKSMHPDRQAVEWRDGTDVPIRPHYDDRTGFFVDPVRIKTPAALPPVHVDIVEEDPRHDVSEMRQDSGENAPRPVGSE